MNIYLINEDGESKCFQAENMQQALQCAEDTYIADLRERKEITVPEREERIYWQSQIIQSCALVGELANA